MPTHRFVLKVFSNRVEEFNPAFQASPQGQSGGQFHTVIAVTIGKLVLDVRGLHRAMTT
jgi:hypothetical protein